MHQRVTFVVLLTLFALPFLLDASLTGRAVNAAYPNAAVGYRTLGTSAVSSSADIRESDYLYYYLQRSNTYGERCPLIGDANGDGQLTRTDVNALSTLVKRYGSGRLVAGRHEKYDPCFDVVPLSRSSFGDGTLDSRDVQALSNIVGTLYRVDPVMGIVGRGRQETCVLNECRTEGEVAIAPRGLRICKQIPNSNCLRWEFQACPSGYRAYQMRQSDGTRKPVCALTQVFEGQTTFSQAFTTDAQAVTPY